MRVKRNYPLLFAKGIAMGAADVVPGVSGGTIAFISGIYDELIDSLRGLNLSALLTLFRKGPSSFWTAINGNFLLVLFTGVITSVFSLAKIVRYCLEQYPLYLWSFFFGLVLASIIYVIRTQRQWGWVQYCGLAVGACAAVVIGFSPPMDVGSGYITVLLSGMLAICAMILPGISGSFILLLIGIYPVIITALTRLDLMILSAFALGAAIGLIVFSHVLSWLLHRHRATTLSVLIGFLVGSLTVVWPWKLEPGQAVDGSVVLIRELMTPLQYQQLFGDAHLAMSLLLMAAGLILVLGLEYAGTRNAQGKEF